MDYDLIVAGGGIAGLSLAARMCVKWCARFCCWNVIYSSTIESGASPFSPGALPRFVSWGSRHPLQPDRQRTRHGSSR